MKRIKYILTIFILCLFATNAFAGPFKADAKTKRIPAGTTFQLEFLQPVSTFSGSAGDSFVAMLMNDQTAGTSVILPAGTVVRGSVAEVKTAKRFSRGAKLYLDFDHVVTPTGRQLPLSLSLMGLEKMTIDGGIYFNKGYGEAVQDNWKKCVDITKSCTNYGMKAGVSAPGIQYVTAPICAIGGVVGGGCYLVGDTVFDLFKKGQDVIFYKGTKFKSKLVYPIDVPVS
jgi:hypothetical protein